MILSDTNDIDDIGMFWKCPLNMSSLIRVSFIRLETAGSQRCFSLRLSEPPFKRKISEGNVYFGLFCCARENYFINATLNHENNIYFRTNHFAPKKKKIKKSYQTQPPCFVCFCLVFFFLT